MKPSLLTVVMVCLGPIGHAAEPAPASLYEIDTAPIPPGPIDSIVLAQLDSLGIQPARICSDAVFVRRVFLDTIGTLPTAEETRQFLEDQAPDKRSVLIDRLLEREEFADYWALKWGDLLRVKAEFPINLWPNAVQAYHHWIRTSLRENTPYDRLVRELLVSSGSNFRVPPVNFYRAVQGQEPRTLARAVALTFMDSRAEAWPPDRWENLAVFFSYVGYKSTGEWKEEIVYFDSLNMAADAPGGGLPTCFPDGTPVTLSVTRDPREVFADWLITPENRWFARHGVDRIGSWLLGRALRHGPDAVQPGGVPGHPELLAYLEKELIGSHYDLKHIYRLILNSQTYQRSPISRSDHPQAAACFASYPLRRLEAEVLIDALCQITGTTEEYSSLIPEPYTFIPARHRSIALADGSITSSFLEMFGRPPRDTGLESERNNGPTAEQRLHLLNSSHIREKIERGEGIQKLVRSGRNRVATARSLYLTILSRYPTEEELRIVQAYSQIPGMQGRTAWIDLAWALINSPEFLYRH